MDSQTATAASLRSWRSLREEVESPDGQRRASTVPTNLAVMLRTTLGGPRRQQCGQVLRCLPPVWRVRAWCGCWAIGGATAGYTSLIFKDGTFSPAPPYWAAVGYSAALLYTAVGVICAIATYEMAEIVGATVDDNEPAAVRHNLDVELLPDESSDRQRNERELSGREAEIGAVSPLQQNPSRRFLRSLVECEVSTTASQVLMQQVKRAKQAVILVATVVASLATMNLTRPGRHEHFDGTERVHFGLLACVVSFWIVFYPCIVILTGWLIFIRAPCVIICDRIKHSAARVRQMAPETADYDAIMGYIHEAHELTVRLEVLLSPTLIGTGLMCSMVSFQWCLAACTVMFCEYHRLDGWIDRTTGQPSVAHMQFSVWFATAFVVQQGPVWQLFAAASTTTACEELVEAVAALRYSRQAPSPGTTTGAAGGIAPDLVGQHKNVKIADPDNLIRIQGLLNFAMDVNRGDGLGLSIRYCRPFRARRPITISFVWRMAFAVGGGMLLLLTLVSVLIQHGASVMKVFE